MQLMYRNHPSHNVKANLRITDKWEDDSRVHVSLDIMSIPCLLLRYLVTAYNFEFFTDYNEDDGFDFHLSFDDPAETAFENQFIVLYLMHENGDMQPFRVTLTEEEFSKIA